MIQISVSKEFFDRVMQNQKDKSVEAFESTAKRIMGFLDVKPTKEKKVMLVGLPGVGKSTIREVFFQYEDPKELLENSLEPTRGIEHFNYVMSDINLSILDSAGQELDFLLETQPDLHFTDLDAVVYVVDAADFSKNQKAAYDLLYRIEKVVRFYSPKAKVSLFLHKVDLLKEPELESFKSRVKARHRAYEQTQTTEIPLYFTSIKEEYITQLKLAFLNLFFL